jgi:hypothetical protein
VRHTDFIALGIFVLERAERLKRRLLERSSDYEPVSTDASQAPSAQFADSILPGDHLLGWASFMAWLGLAFDPGS